MRKILFYTSKEFWKNLKKNLNINKYDFYITRIKYFKLIIIIKGIKTNYYKNNIIR